MPTGYTAAIGEGITFEKFVLSCARAFGALIEMRDDPMDAPIPEKFEPSNHNVEELNRAQRRMGELRAMTALAAQIGADAAYEAEDAAYAKRRAGKLALKAKYEAMLAQVNAWQAPTPNHIGLKDFMAKQIIDSIGFDCCEYPEDRPKKLTGPEWLAEEIARAQWDIDYHTKHHAEEVERVNSRNEWVAALRDSLKQREAV